MGEGASRDPLLAHTVGGSAATAPSVTLPHTCLLHYHEKPRSVGHSLECPGKAPTSWSTQRCPPTAHLIIHLPWTNTCLFPSASSLLGVTRCSSLSLSLCSLKHAASHHLFLTPGDMYSLVFLFADARPFPPLTLLPAHGHLVLAAARATCSLLSYLFPLMAAAGQPLAQPPAPDRPSAQPPLRGSGAINPRSPPSQGHFGRAAVAGGDIEQSPAGGVHSSETAAAGKMGPVRREPREHLPRLGDTRAALAHHKISRAGRDPQGPPAEDALGESEHPARAQTLKASTAGSAPAPQSPAGRSRAWKSSAELPARDKGGQPLCQPPWAGARGCHKVLSAGVGQPARLP